MAGQPRRARAGLTLVFVAILIATFFGPIGAKAETDLVLGGQARIAYANGDDVRLRESPAGTLIRYVPEGSTVDVLDGPSEDDDGNLWFEVAYDGDMGYIVSDYLALLRGDDEVSANSVVDADTGDVIGSALIANTSNDGVRCRTEPSSGGAVITVVPEGTWVDLTGAATGDWQPINCGGMGGFVSARYVSYDGTGTDNKGDGDGESMAAAASSTDSGKATGSALIANTSGDGVTCRTEPGPDGGAITVVSEGTSVELAGNAIGDWQPINCGGKSGYVSVRYVSYDGSGTDNIGDGDDSTVSASDPPGNARLAAAGDVATVSGTNGDGVNCRSSGSSRGNVITIVPEGSSVSLRGTPRGDWQPVVCAGSNGYVSTQFLDVSDGGGGSGDGGGSDSGGDDATGEATVSGTNGDGVNCRTRASTSSSVIVILPEGTDVTLRGGASGGWQPVFCGGSQGFVSSQFLSSGGGGGSSNGGGSGDGGSGTVTGEATVTGTGNGLRCRTRGSFDGSVITVLSDGAGVSLRGDVQGDWQPVVCNGRNGFVAASYLDYDGNGGGGSDGGGGGSSGGGSAFSEGTTVVVDGTNGEGVRLRSGRSTSSAIVMVVGEGQKATVISGGNANWVAVTYKGTSGFISSSYVAASSGGGGGSGDDGGGGGGGLSVGGRAQTTADLNLRYDPSMSGGVAAVAPSGTVVKVTGGSSSGFYAVDWDGLSGYMSGDYLRATSRALSDRGGSGNNPAPSNPGGGGGSATGNAIVDYAMQYVGYPYVWATRGPSSFDCSGFTYWVVLNVTGKDITAGTSAQINYGTPISRGSIKPGDLIFFQNTYTWGLSHVGIYIGGGKFVHAENESTGVVVSDLGSSYYSSRWYGARRVT